MKTQFIPYELAVKLKDLGFKRTCLAEYIDGTFYLSTSLNSKKKVRTIASAPLWQQAFDWCLDRLNQTHSFYVCFGGSDKCLIIQNYFTNTSVTLLNNTKEKCLEKLIEIIEQQIEETKS